MTSSDRIPLAAAAVLGLTAVGALLALVDPTLAGRTAPHAALNGTVADAVSILQNNLRVLAVPFLLAALRFPASRLGRHSGDAIVAGLIAASTIPVGIALGRWQERLVPYLPQLPLEWAALTVATGAWLTARRGNAQARELAILGATVGVLLIGAASLETWCTPQRITDTRAATPSGRSSEAPWHLWVSVVAFVTEFAPATTGSLQGRLLPSPHQVRFRSVVWPALTALHQPPTPTRRGQMLTINGNGNITRAPELRNTASGKAVTTVSVACQQRKADDGPAYVDLILW